MPILIATDEAGYGPKLGPLVIVASVWWYPSGVSLAHAFSALCDPFTEPGCSEIAIDDSKRVFKRDDKSSQTRLDTVCSAASEWCGLPCPRTAFGDWLTAVAPLDLPALQSDACLAAWTNQRIAPEASLHIALNRSLIAHWSRTGAKLISLQARVLTPQVFNNRLHRGENKADILTQSTCGLVLDTLTNHTARMQTADQSVLVFSDRHGGRTFYAAALQHATGQGVPQIVEETPATSRYHLAFEQSDAQAWQLEWSFTVGGDSFAPVSLSSLIAKWLREQAMNEFNRYFQQRVTGVTTLRPTAGYHVDANRFLADLEQVGLRHSIAEDQLVRRK